MRSLILLLAASLLATPVAADGADANGCSEKSWSSGTMPEHTVTVHADCTVDVELNKGIICVGPWTATDEYHAGPVTVISHRCAYPGGPGGSVELATSAEAPCKPLHVDGIVSVAVSSDCNVLISIRAYECVWGGYWHEYTPAPAQVREYRCGDPPA